MKKLVIILICVFVFIPFFSVYSEGETKILLPAYVNQNGDQKWGFINDSGEFAIEPKYDDIGKFNSKGFAFVSSRVDRLYYFYNQNEIYLLSNEGKVILGPFFGSYKDFNDGYGIVNDKNVGNIVISEEGKVLFTTKYSIISVSEGMFMFRDKGNYEKIGYMDMSGKIVVPLKYKMSSSDFNNGTAKVTIDGNKYFYINKKGKIVEGENDKTNTNNSSGLISFKDEKSGKYGYKFIDGKIAIKPSYVEVEEFMGDRAIVTVDLGDYNLKLGVINSKGEYVIKPEHTSINSLGNGLFCVNDKGYSKYDYMFYPNAIFDNDGKKISDYAYYSIESFKGDYASACNDTQTFFIDKSGQIAKALPVVEGIGSLKFIDDIIEYSATNSLSYYKKDATLIWSSSSEIDFGSGLKVIRNTFRPNYYVYVEYPSLSGLKDIKMQEKVNKKLESLVLGDKDIYINKEYKEDGDFVYTQENTFNVRKNKDLIIFGVNDSMYPIGAAHGTYGVTDYHLNIKTGDIYSLKDLFVKNSKYKDRLTSIIRNRIKLENRISQEDFSYGGVSETALVNDDTGFAVHEDSLEIYFQPYEVASYARGIVSIDIPYGQIIDIIDTKGGFWSSFNKNVLKTKINYLTYVDSETSKKIQSQIKAYETTLISAINSNNFKEVEPLLYKGSSIYKDQKNLVLSLSKKGIKEKLNSYEIYAIGYVEQNEEYKVYVMENIGIKYPPKKTYTSSKYSWCYTLKYEKESKTIKLTKISKW